MGARIIAFFEKVTETFSYLVIDPLTQAALIIDPVLDYDPAARRIRTHSADAIAKAINAAGLRVEGGWDVVGVGPQATWIKRCADVALAVVVQGDTSASATVTADAIAGSATLADLTLTSKPPSTVKPTSAATAFISPIASSRCCRNA